MRPGLQNSAPIIAIGGIGGSGTRACAQVLLNAGYHLGSDLNDALDNLTFSLIFKRHSALVWNRKTLERRLDGFLYHLQTGRLPVGMAAELDDIPAAGRAGHSSDWLSARLVRAQQGGVSPEAGFVAWKEPNTHILIERILEIEESIKYIHVIRDYNYMVGSKNVNQLKNWAHLFLDEECSDDPHCALSYWFSVQERMLGIRARFPDRVLFLSYDRMKQETGQQIAAMLAFCGSPAPKDPEMLMKELDFAESRASSVKIVPDSRQAKILAEVFDACA